MAPHSSTLAWKNLELFVLGLTKSIKELFSFTWSFHKEVTINKIL